MVNLPFTIEELKLLGDMCDGQLKMIEKSQKLRERIPEELEPMQGQWSMMNAMRTLFREQQYGLERQAQD